MDFLFRYGILIAILPALLVIGAIQVLTKRAATDGETSRDQRSARKMALIYLVAAILLSLPFAVTPKTMMENAVGLIVLLLLPALVSLLAILVLHGRDLVDLWRSAPIWITALLAILAFLVALPALGQPTFPIVVLVFSLLVAGIWAVGQRVGSGLLGVGIICLLLLLLDAAGIAGSPSLIHNDRLRIVYGLGSVLVPFLSLACAAWLIHQALGEDSKSRRRLRLLVAGLLLAGLFATILRYGVLVNATSHAFEDRLPFFGIASAVIAGLLLALTGERRSHLVGIAFTILVPALILFAYMLGWLVDAHAITARRSTRIAGAIQQYHQENGAYPQSLDDLTPQYLPFLVGPLNGRGTRWCYQGGADFYRLGYIFYQRYYDATFHPFSEIKVLGASGEAPDGAWMCDDELERMKLTGGF